MKHRAMPNSPDRISALGFGLMRLPVHPDGKIDEDKALEMLRYAFKHGVNYFDTAWPYHDGESEPLLGKFLSTIDRSKALVATKLPCWLIKTREDMDDYLNRQLERLQTDYIDYYLLHSLGQHSWQNLSKLKVWDFLQKAKADGKIRFLGFSFHDRYSVFKKIADRHPWDFCQIMLNYLDTRYQAGIRGYELAVSKGMGVIAMEPLRGGKLIHPIPESVNRLWEKSQQPRKPVERALRWVWNLPGATVLLSGMSDLRQMKENIRFSALAEAGNLDAKELELYRKVRREYIRRIAVPCTECRYCLPCPFKVAIPWVFGIYNEAVMFGDKERHKREYQNFIPDDNKAEKCTACGACVPKCPQKINIPEEMKKVREFFS
jgi:predicted aldo/keto reductase-like oxidoreductase